MFHRSFGTFFATALTVATACADSSRSAKDERSGTTRRGSGSLLPWDSILKVLTPRPNELARFAALVVGNPMIEIIVETDDGKFRATAIEGPTRSACSDPYPTSLELVDVDEDELLDLVVLDPVCGNWFALQEADGGFTPSPWDRFMPDVTTYWFLKALRLGRGDDYATLTVSMPDSVQVLRGVHRSWTKSNLQFGQPYVAATVTSLIVELPDGKGGTTALFQRGYQLQSLQPSGDRLLKGTELRQVMTDSIYTVPSDGLDHVHTTENCQDRAVGIGVFSPSAGRTPFPLLSLSTEDESLVASDLGLDISAESIALVDSEDETLAAVLGQDNEGPFLTVVALSHGCSRVASTSKQNRKHFDLKRLQEQSDPAESGRPHRYARVPIIGVDHRPGIEFMLYDGYSVHSFASHPQCAHPCTEFDYSRHAVR